MPDVLGLLEICQQDQTWVKEPAFSKLSEWARAAQLSAAMLTPVDGLDDTACWNALHQLASHRNELFMEALCWDDSKAPAGVMAAEWFAKLPLPRKLAERIKASDTPFPAAWFDTWFTQLWEAHYNAAGTATRTASRSLMLHETKKARNLLDTPGSEGALGVLMHNIRHLAETRLSIFGPDVLDQMLADGIVVAFAVQAAHALEIQSGSTARA